MLTERDGVQIKLHCITIEDLVPEGHFLRKVEKAVDFSFIYNEVRNLYCPDNGRPGIDPVILVKYLLDKYEAEERERLEATGAIKPQRAGRVKEAKNVERTINTTDPDAGMLGRRGKPEGMCYLSHQSVDAAHGIVVDVTVTPGNTNDFEPYLERIEYMREQLGLPIQTAGADGAYGTSMIYRAMEDMGIQLHTPKRTGGATYKVEFRREDFQYEAEKDRFICPAGKYLRLRSLERENFNICRIYRVDRKACKACPILNRCVSDSHRSRTVRVNIFEDAVKRQREADSTPTHKHILNLRQIWCEGSFAAQKWTHNLRRLFRRGIEAARRITASSRQPL